MPLPGDIHARPRGADRGDRGAARGVPERQMLWKPSLRIPRCLHPGNSHATVSSCCKWAAVTRQVHVVGHSSDDSFHLVLVMDFSDFTV